MNSNFSKIPTVQQTHAMLSEAGTLNPGPWVQHSRYVGESARAIAEQHPDLASESAYIFGCLHDIGRREGPAGARHILDGYRYLHSLGYEDAARICITHAFPVANMQAVAGGWDCSEDELEFIEDYISKIEFNDYDHLIQLCDALVMPSGPCLMEKRLMDVALRHGTDEYIIKRWQACVNIQKEFEAVIGTSIYRLLPGVIENTFGFK
jgi:hypothetical protein